MNNYNNEEIEKIRNIKSLLTSCDKLDKTQLLVLFQTGGFTDVSEKVIDHIFHHYDFPAHCLSLTKVCTTEHELFQFGLMRFLVLSSLTNLL